jgi:hypothetical protein
MEIVMKNMLQTHLNNVTQANSTMMGDGVKISYSLFLTTLAATAAGLFLSQQASPLTALMVTITEFAFRGIFLGVTNVFEYFQIHPIESFAASFSIGGAMLLASKGKYAAWAWVLFIAATLLWIYYALTLSAPSSALLVQQLFFLGINVMGTWRWLIQPALKEKSQKNGE